MRPCQLRPRLDQHVIDRPDLTAKIPQHVLQSGRLGSSPDRSTLTTIAPALPRVRLALDVVDAVHDRVAIEAQHPGRRRACADD